MLNIQVKFFAIFREMTGIKAESKQVADGTTVEQLWREYRTDHARLGNIRPAYAVNKQLAGADHVLRDGDEIAFLPPVSGGATARKGQRQQEKKRRNAVRPINKDALITSKPLDLNALYQRVVFPGAGAIITFSGVVRDNARGKAVDHLEYEAYAEMAEHTMMQIIAEIRQRWPETRVAMAHRTGTLQIGEASLIIAVAAPHRPQAYATSRYAIERVKAILPVWKKEFVADGEYWVEGPTAGDSPADEAEAIALGQVTRVSSTSSRK